MVKELADGMSLETLKEKLKHQLEQMKAKNEKLDVITFAGKGEPTMHPEFSGIIDDTMEIRRLLWLVSRAAASVRNFSSTFASYRREKVSTSVSSAARAQDHVPPAASWNTAPER